MGILCSRADPIDLDGEVELNHFMLLRSVGKGAFGKVRVVQHRGRKKIYALKYINKAKCIQMRAVENIIQERRLLEEVENNFICNLRYAFQDDENLFMVLDLMLGGDLRFHLDRMGSFTPQMLRVYVAELSCGLAYLHSRKIVHRDLKPDNILLDSQGHAHLTDFNIAVRFRDDKPLTAVAGSMAYMAPEILMKKGYFSSIDWWSLGVIIYELYLGKRPFKAKSNEGLQSTILNDPIVFPPKRLDSKLVDLIQQFLIRDISSRLGTKESGGVIRIHNHPFFYGMDWNLVEQKKLTPPFVPDSKKSNFDATHELEELLLEDNPLRIKPKKHSTEQSRSSISYISEKDEAILRSRFKVYDYSKVDRSRPLYY